MCWALARLGTAEIQDEPGNWEQGLELRSDLAPPQPWPAVQMRCEAPARLCRTVEAQALLEQQPLAERDWRWRLTRPEWRFWADDNHWAWSPSLQLIQQQHRGDWRRRLEQAAGLWRAG